jgi:hypothetical protein
MNKQVRTIFLAGSIAALIAAVLLVLLMLWAKHSTLEAMKYAQRVRNLKAIYVALVYYSDEHGGLPAASSTAEVAGPAHSWRVLLLPFLDRESLYSKVNLNEPWDGQANRQLLGEMPENYRSPMVDDKRSTQANYFAVTGPHAPWWRGKVTKPPTSSGSKEILLVELPGSKTPWMEPYDPTLEELLDMLRPQAGPSGAGVGITEILCITVHGEVKTVSVKTDRESLRNVFLESPQKSNTVEPEENIQSR